MKIFIKTFTKLLFMFSHILACSPDTHLDLRQVIANSGLSIPKFLGANHGALAATAKDMLSPELRKAADEADPEGAVKRVIRKDLAGKVYFNNPRNIEFNINKIQYSTATKIAQTVRGPFHEFIGSDATIAALLKSVEYIYMSKIPASEFGLDINKSFDVFFKFKLNQDFNQIQLFCELSKFIRSMKVIFQDYEKNLVREDFNSQDFSKEISLEPLNEHLIQATCEKININSVVFNKVGRT